MTTLVFFLEEPSAREALRGLLPRLVAAVGVEFHYIVFQGKQDLEKQLKRKLQGWMKPDSYFIVLRDQDSGDCLETKSKLYAICEEAGQPDTLIRIACHELESWYLGDLSAVERALEIPGLADKQEKSKYRNPDRLNNAAQELSRLTSARYQKLAGSRAIGEILNLESNRSHSFRIFLSGINRVVANIENA